jgi:CDP-glycerol glycerophosphotransferase
VLRDGSREHYEAFAHARYVVTNDHFPFWFERRADQVCLQTWHGTPLKRVGFDSAAESPGDRRFRRTWERQAGNWQYVLSQSPYATSVLSRAYRIEGEVLETGWPRNDVLAGAGARRAEARRRLGLAEAARVVLYAPTFRDDARDTSGRYRLATPFDGARLRAALGDDAVVLFRRHRYVVDPAPETADGFVRDVSRHPDMSELLLAADVLVTDYSSVMFDFANTGRPMLFFTYDLEAYRDHVRGFNLDFEARAPGPLLRTLDELAGALRDVDAAVAPYRSRYREFATEFCSLDDGGAAARVVDRVFG